MSKFDEVIDDLLFIFYVILLIILFLPTCYLSTHTGFRLYE